MVKKRSQELLDQMSTEEDELSPQTQTMGASSQMKFTTRSGRQKKINWKTRNSMIPPWLARSKPAEVVDWLKERRIQWNDSDDALTDRYSMVGDSSVSSWRKGMKKRTDYDSRYDYVNQESRKI